MLYIMLFLDAEALVRSGGLMLLCLLVFCSTGVTFCFFLPLGGVLFTTGIMAATGNMLPPVALVCALLTLSSIAGSMAGYAVGRSTGKFFYSRRDTRFFRRSYLDSTGAFYKKHGSMAMIAGYFLPIVRTFAPLLAGIIKVKFQRFLLFSIIGSAAFISALVMAGYLIGSMPFLRPWLKYLVPFFMLAVTIPLVIKIVRTMRKPRET